MSLHLDIIKPENDVENSQDVDSQLAVVKGLVACFSSQFSFYCSYLSTFL